MMPSDASDTIVDAWLDEQRRRLLANAAALNTKADALRAAGGVAEADALDDRALAMIALLD